MSDDVVDQEDVPPAHPVASSDRITPGDDAEHLSNESTDGAQDDRVGQLDTGGGVETGVRACLPEIGVPLAILDAPHASSSRRWCFNTTAPSRRVCVDATTIATSYTASDTTARVGVHPQAMRPQPIDPGQYDVVRGGELVGKLIVEPYDSNTRQHWFVFDTSAPSRAPIAISARTSENVESIDLAQFARQLDAETSYFRVQIFDVH